MKRIKIFCFGFGQVAKSYVNKLKYEKIDFDLSTTSRNKTKKLLFDNTEYQSYYFDGKNFDKEIIKKLDEANYILISIAPVDGKDIVFEKFQSELSKKNFKWITYLSATSVYGNHDGEWVDENSETNPTSDNGIQRLKVEQQWQKFAKENNKPLQIFRLSGIYSNQSNVLKRLKLGEAKIIKKPNHFFSRIHVEDIANILFTSMKKFKSGEIYNISDDKPASSEEVTIYGAQLSGMDKPKAISVNEIESQMLKNFYKDSKKVSNKKMKNFFDLELKYPTYVEGLKHIMDHSV